MKILLTGGGTGGHFYPIISIAQNIRKIAEDKKILQPEIFYVADQPYDEDLLFKNDITFKKLSSGKLRLYFSILNFFDLFKTTFAVIKSFSLIFSIYPDIIFTNGGFGSFPILLAARFFRIPVFLHASDSVPGRVILWASKFAKKISIGFPETSQYLPRKKIAYAGNPIRRGLGNIAEQGAHEFLKLNKNVPTIFILGGSQGSQIINETIIDILPQLVEKYQIIHQTGKNNFNDVSGRAQLVLEKNINKDRYKPFKFLEFLALKMSAGAANLVISRAGAGSISEIAIWGLPSITIPITDSSGDHQRQNAFSYARFNATAVIEEINLTPNLLLAEINRILGDEELIKKMSAGAKDFSKPNAAEKIANQILEIGLEHEN